MQYTNINTLFVYFYTKQPSNTHDEVLIWKNDDISLTNIIILEDFIAYSEISKNKNIKDKKLRVLKDDKSNI